jgi:tRNA threonylcarbamoyladenosine biosynthesis protein TsaB
MKIQGILLGFDSSAVSASCAAVEGGKPLAQASVNTKITHSQTLMPLAQSVLTAAGLTFGDIDAFAVANGPGSFTGLRISVSAVKGLGFALGKPVCGVSTLLSLAYNLVGQDVIACAVMDARRNEFYNALFRTENERITRLTPDRAISAQDLATELERDFALREKVVLVGDGAELAHELLGRRYVTAPEHTRRQSALSVCFAAQAQSDFTDVKQLMPVYIRKPQAQKELERKQS